MFFIIGITAFMASMLTLFSGFGLGTIMLPVMGLFFPIHIAVALTGVVHLLNNLFKLTLVGKHADRRTVMLFGVPSVMGGFAGAWLLSRLLHLPVLHVWHWNGSNFEITVLKLVIGFIMLLFALQELTPMGRRLRFEARFLSAGGLLSGFFGGLSGHQGALRSAFLINAGLSKSAYIATGVVVACFVDFTRIPVYFSRFMASELTDEWQILLVAVLSAFAGAFVGARYMQKITYSAVRWITGILIVLIGLMLMTGVL